MNASERIPAVSVVVPCYNGGRFIDQLLELFAAQTYRDFEIIIVDDGSDDADTKARLAALDPSVRVIRQENGGCGAARNTGIAAARAGLIFQVDCDDVIAPNMLAEVVSAMLSAAPDVGAVVTYLCLGGPEGEVLPRHFDRFALLFTNTVSSCFLIRKEAWAKIGGYDEAMRDGYEDWELALNLTRSGYRGISVPKPLYVYYYTVGGLLFGRSSQRHGALWRHIRNKHRDLYRLPAILKLWWQTRGGPPRISLVKALAMLAFAELTSDSYQSGVITRRRRSRFFGNSASAAR